jgi:hypothetical protein
MRYLNGTIELRFTMGGGTDHNSQLTSYGDADRANDTIYIITHGPVICSH